MIESRNPATLEPIGKVALTPPEAASAVVAGVAAVMPLWAQLRVADRARYLERAAQGVIDSFDELCELIIAETGRPRVEVEAFELLAAIDTLQWLATNARRLLSAHPITLPRTVHPLKRASAGHTPRGVAAVISAGSSPFATPVAHIAAALLGGNGAVFKPARSGSQAAEGIGLALARAGLPEGLVAIVHGRGDLAAALVREPGVAHVLFSGSDSAGAAVAGACAARGAGVTLELDSSEAMIVLADADVPAAAAGAMWAACAGTGQLQGKLARIYVERAAHDSLLERLVTGAQELAVGDPTLPDTQLGPLANAARRDRLEEVISSCTARGARLHCGEALAVEGLAGAFHSPTVLSGSADQLESLRGRVCGPVLGVTPVDGPVEAVALEACAPIARGASVWSSDRRHAARIARELRSGAVWCNDHVVGPVLPRDAANALAACVSGKLITWDPSGTRAPWRFPYDATSSRALRALAALHGTRPGDRERALRGGAAPLARIAARALRGRG
jgi:acyl-CoA reductase-like NAD-dependent aldehyde dehydrogenase